MTGVQTCALPILPAATLKAMAGHGTVADVLRRDGGDGTMTLGEFAKFGVGIDALAEKLQRDGAEAFVESWRDLLRAIDAKTAALGKRAGSTGRSHT